MSDYAWMMNNQGDDPCHLVVLFGEWCYSGADLQFLVWLGSQNINHGPPDFCSSPCVCSTMGYSLISACAICQGLPSVMDPWLSYSHECQATYITSYPAGMPSATKSAIPNWAYLPLSSDGRFDALAAESLATQSTSSSAKTHSITVSKVAAPSTALVTSSVAVTSTSRSNSMPLSESPSISTPTPHRQSTHATNTAPSSTITSTLSILETMTEAATSLIPSTSIDTAPPPAPSTAIAGATVPRKDARQIVAGTVGALLVVFVFIAAASRIVRWRRKLKREQHISPLEPSDLQGASEPSGKQSRPSSHSHMVEHVPGPQSVYASSVVAVPSTSSARGEGLAEEPAMVPAQAPITLSSLVKRLARERSVTAAHAPMRRTRSPVFPAIPYQESDSGWRLPAEEASFPPPYTRN
ncbi:hypothetical protein BD310DRAFT_940415 [Dichomitus squalens]|uniref:Transmembrane protein n=1 Tax=Dichomitus squalens TaxID=114155 RepID=A0A4Q9PE48_9APHY|nr:hypothetical protein BD310DRAFT_940415 [Dichomitus squalens]